MTGMNWHRLLGWTVAGLVLGTVFLAYLQPELMQQLSQQLWACF